MKKEETNTVQDRILLRMKELGLKNKDLVNATRASRGTVSQWVHGGNKPSADFIPSLAKALKVTEEWLINGGAIFARDKDPGLHLKPLRKIPLFSLEQAGDWRNLMNSQNIDKWICTPDDVSSSAFTVIMNNDSMVSSGSVSIPEGSVVTVDPEASVSSGRIVLAQINTTACTVKKLVIDGDDMYLMPLNSNFKSTLLSSLSQVIGVCIAMQTKLP